MWVFGYGSLIWGTGEVKPVERRVGVLQGWHREWTWISRKRHGAPTWSLGAGGQVRGVFLRLDPRTLNRDLETFRRRERGITERTVGESRAQKTPCAIKDNNWQQSSEPSRACPKSLLESLPQVPDLACLKIVNLAAHKHMFLESPIRALSRPTEVAKLAIWPTQVDARPHCFLTVSTELTARLSALFSACSQACSNTLLPRCSERYLRGLSSLRRIPSICLRSAGVNRGGFKRAFRERSKPSSVRGPVLKPPCIRHRPVAHCWPTAWLTASRSRPCPTSLRGTQVARRISVLEPAAPYGLGVQNFNST